MIRVLIVGMHDKIGGTETFLMNYYRNIDRNKIQFDFINMYDKICFEDEIIKLGGKIYNIPNVKKNPFGYYQKIKKIIRENDYKIVYDNMLSAANILPIMIAKRNKVNTIIAHAHNTDTPKGIIRKILDKLNKKRLYKNATNFLAASDLAGKWMFGDQVKYTIVNNAIDMQKFIFNQEKRDKIRRELKIENNFVIGHVGRFCEQKNHSFLIRVFQELKRKKANMTLLLIGEGETETQIKHQVKDLGLSVDVKFIGVVDNVCDYFQAMDLFLLPSKFEGLGIVLLEAQTSGLRCIASDNIPKESNIFQKVLYLPLKENIWVDEIVKLENEKCERNIESDRIENNSYNIKIQAKEMQNYIESVVDIS